MRLECGCPSEYPDWDGKDIDLGGTLVHEQQAPMFLHMPIGFEAKLDMQLKDIRRLELHEKWPGFVLTETGMFRGRLLCPLEDEHSPARSILRLPRPFNLRVRVYNGDVGGIRSAIAEMQSELLEEARMPRKLFLSYLTCPRCQEERGGMRVMLLRQWEHNSKLEKRIAARNRQA